MVLKEARGKSVIYFQVITWLVLISLFAACNQLPVSTNTGIQQGKSMTPQSTLSPTPFGGISAQLGPLPHDCPTGPNPQSIPQITNVVGTFPVWAAFAKVPLTLEWTLNEATQFHTQYGWSHKFLWVVDANYKGGITLSGANLQDGTPLLPRADEPGSTSTFTSLVLNTQNTAIPVGRRIGHWVEFPGGLIIPKAGCYQLKATWAKGSWQIPFAAGLAVQN